MKKKLLTSFIGIILTLSFAFQSCGQSNKKQAQKSETEDVNQPTKEHKVTFIELGSVRCIPCQKMQPIMKSIEKKYAKQVEVIFYDVWTSEGKPYANKYHVTSIPTQVFLDKDGNEFSRHIGYFPENELIKVLEQKGIK